ncbi:facilitated trehalose transporter Tret1-like [Eurytemora carolleeae]|uniref:facilitated trehalose transporter Tret1-like n=1 Tax=Eurytemora carolleeae TaxID=1294199 RepID=UPI000C7585B3|nr:facilitated trehalose transporter Tret1-like [Eurytemora carolleeae]|eukprot:XP_023348032.1 facilitated trehalose transporter Tret1-like [Eurytemora affinis]
MILAGALVSSPLSEWLGRKRCLILVNLLQIGSCILMWIAYTFPILLSGWLLNGFSAGLGIMPSYTLVSEISTIKLRGVFANLNILYSNYGWLLLFAVNMTIPPEYLLLLGITLSVLFLLLSPFIVYSPHWLVRNGKIKKAREMLRILRGPEYAGIEEEINEILAATKKYFRNKNGCMDRWTTPQTLIPLGIVVTMFGSIGLCGRGAPLNFYGPRKISLMIQI